MTKTADPTTDLAKLSAVEAEMRKLQEVRVRLIATAQQRGASWGAISAILGISRQAAWEMYRDRARQILDRTAVRATSSEDEILASASQVLRGMRAQRRRR